jgi:hypothetical protein
MSEKKRDDAAIDPVNETKLAAARLQLSVKRMKRLRAGVKGGLEEGTQPPSWMAN